MEGGLRKLWPWSLAILGLCFLSLSEARHHPHKTFAVVIGAVLCDTCFQDDMSKSSHYIAGATVVVECAGRASRPAFYQEIKTDKQGQFKVQLPFPITKHVKKIEECTLKLVKSSEPNCSVASTATSSLVHLKNQIGGKHIFSAGIFTFKPLKQSDLCDQKTSITKSHLQSYQDLFQNPEISSSIPTIQNPQVPTLPTLFNSPASTNPNTPLVPIWPYIPFLPSFPELPKLPPLQLLSPFPVTPVNPYKDEVESGLLKHPQQLFPPVISSPQDYMLNVPNTFHPPSPPIPPVSPLPNRPNFPPVLLPPTPTISSIIPPFLPLPSTPLFSGIPSLKTKEVNP